jgi:uncharacterized beta-barrel protein YwiB (DUF1934 family)
MKDVLVNVEIKSIEIGIETMHYDVKGKYDDLNRVLSFVEPPIEEDQEETISTFKSTDRGIQMIRENDEMRMEVEFIQDENTSGVYDIKQFGVHFPVKVMTDSVEDGYEQGVIRVKYYLELNFEDQGLFEVNISFKEEK